MNSVILIDDQPITNFITRKLLELQGVQITISEFTNPVLALQSVLAQREQDNMIILDLNMPEMSGWDFLDKLVHHDFAPNIVILTSSTSGIDRETAKQYPFVRDYIIKPLNKDKISELCAKHCR